MIRTYFLCLLVFSFTVLITAQDDLPPEPIPLTINESTRGNTNENDTYSVTLEDGQTVVIALQQIFDACVALIGPDGEVILEDNDVAEYRYATIVPFLAQETGTYTIKIGDFRCDSFTDERGFLLSVYDRDGYYDRPFPVLNAAPTEQIVSPIERLHLADFEAGHRYRLTVSTAEDIPSNMTLALTIDETPNAGLDEYTLTLRDARYAEYVFEADHTGRAFVNVTYRLPNPAVTDGIVPIEIMLTLEDITE